MVHLVIIYHILSAFYFSLQANAIFTWIRVTYTCTVLLHNTKFNNIYHIYIYNRILHTNECNLLHTWFKNQNWNREHGTNLVKQMYWLRFVSAGHHRRFSLDIYKCKPIVWQPLNRKFEREQRNSSKFDVLKAIEVSIDSLSRTRNFMMIANCRIAAAILTCEFDISSLTYLFELHNFKIFPLATLAQDRFKFGIHTHTQTHTQVMTIIGIADMTIVTPSSNRFIIISKHVDCERQCPYYYFPICGTNGDDSKNRMFVNTCKMHAWNCDVEKS